MKRILIPILALFGATASFGALAELNVAEGTIMSPDGSFAGRDFQVVPGFKLELLYVTNLNTEGQWVALGWDSKHRLLIPAYNSDKLARVTIPNVGSSAPVQVEMINTTQVGAAEGVLEAFGGIYINANRSTTMRSGIYKLTDTNGDDKPDTTKVIRNRQGSGDHGTHTLQLSPDKQWITMISGNATNPTDLTHSRVPKIWGEDNLVIRPDLTPPGFHRAPEAHIDFVNADASQVSLWNAGMRNPVSHAFNKDGEIFVYDADEEPNMGFTVGYRPTDIIHATSGSDAGWRSGSKVHPYWYFDYFGPLAPVGSGSPVGSTFGTGTKFPARYQDAFFAGDWSFGNLWAVFLTPEGSSYKAEPMPFISGRPFPVSGVVPNTADGSFIMLTTGTQVYRVTYVGNEDTTATKPDERFKYLRDIRYSLEKYHGVKNNAAVQAVWPYLSDSDRAIRYAARTALEWQDVAQWRDRALDEKDPRKAIAAIASLARVSHNDQYHTVPGSPGPDKALETRMLAALDRIAPNEISYQDKLDLIRAYHLVMIRMGLPDESSRARIIAKFDAMLPGQYQELNRMIAETLVYLQAPSAATKIMALLNKSPDNPYYGIPEWINPQQRLRQDRGDVIGQNTGIPQAQIAKQDSEIFYAQLLRTVTAGWTPELRKSYMEYFITAPKNYTGSMNGLAILRTDAISAIPQSERGALQSIIDTPMPNGLGRGGPNSAQFAIPAAPRATAVPVVTPGFMNPNQSLYQQSGGALRAFTDIEVTQMTKFDETVVRELRANIAATDAALEAPFKAPATIQAKVQALADTELALAMARAAGWSKLKAELKPTPEKMAVLPVALTTRGGRGVQLAAPPLPPAPTAPTGRGN